jgi:hypothetical protein
MNALPDDERQVTSSAKDLHLTLVRINDHDVRSPIPIEIAHGYSHRLGRDRKGAPASKRTIPHALQDRQRVRLKISRDDVRRPIAVEIASGSRHRLPPDENRLPRP